MEDTEMSRRKKDALQAERAADCSLTFDIAGGLGVSLAVCLFYEAPLKNDSLRNPG